MALSLIDDLIKEVSQIQVDEDVMKSPPSSSNITAPQESIQKQTKEKVKEVQKEKKINIPTQIKKDKNQSDISRLDFRVGKVLTCEKHPDSVKLYVETIDVGEDKPRQIVSGLQEFMKPQDIKDSMCVIFCNLKVSKLRGVESNGMLMCACNGDRSKIEILKPPIGSKIGDRLILQGEDWSNSPPDEMINTKKKNSPWMKVDSDLKTSEECVACYKGTPFVTNRGELIKCDSISNGIIS